MFFAVSAFERNNVHIQRAAVTKITSGYPILARPVFNFLGQVRIEPPPLIQFYNQTNTYLSKRIK